MIPRYKIHLVEDGALPYEVHHRFGSSREVYAFLCAVLQMDRLASEEMVVLAMDQRRSLLGTFMAGKGSVASCMVSAKEIFKFALLCNAQAIILAHNHPSGSVEISQEDRMSTRRIIEAGRILEVEVTDHLIVGRGAYCSMAEYGIMA